MKFTMYPIGQMIFAFSFGVIASVFGYNSFWFIVYFIVYELIIAMYYKFELDLFFRVGLVALAIYGWIIGRTLIEADCIWEGIPF